MLTPEQLADIRAIYKARTRVRFLGFGAPDPTQLELGTLGTIRWVDDLGTVHVHWDNGVQLGCVVIPTGSKRADFLELVDDAE